MGHSGWVGYDMYCEYSDMVSRRNSRIYSNAMITDRTISNNMPEERNLSIQKIVEEESSSSYSDSKSDGTNIFRNSSTVDRDISA